MLQAWGSHSAKIGEGLGLVCRHLSSVGADTPMGGEILKLLPCLSSVGRTSFRANPWWAQGFL